MSIWGHSVLCLQNVRLERIQFMLRTNPVFFIPFCPLHVAMTAFSIRHTAFCQ
jgi:hypothetical protein